MNRDLTIRDLDDRQYSLLCIFLTAMGYEIPEKNYTVDKKQLDKIKRMLDK